MPTRDQAHPRICVSGVFQLDPARWWDCCGQRILPSSPPMVTVTAVATLLSISCTWVSFQRARVFSQKIAAVTPSRPSPRAFRRKALRYAGVRLDTTALEFVCIGGLSSSSTISSTQAMSAAGRPKPARASTLAASGLSYSTGLSASLIGPGLPPRESAPRRMHSRMGTWRPSSQVVRRLSVGSSSPVRSARHRSPSAR